MMMNRRGFFATAMATLLTKKMPMPRPTPLPVGCVFAPYKVVYRTPMIRLSDIGERRFARLWSESPFQNYNLL